MVSLTLTLVQGVRGGLEQESVTWAALLGGCGVGVVEVGLGAGICLEDFKIPSKTCFRHA